MGKNGFKRAQVRVYTEEVNRKENWVREAELVGFASLEVKSEDV